MTSGPKYGQRRLRIAEAQQKDLCVVFRKEIGSEAKEKAEREEANQRDCPNQWPQPPRAAVNLGVEAWNACTAPSCCIAIAYHEKQVPMHPKSPSTRTGASKWGIIVRPQEKSR